MSIASPGTERFTNAPPADESGWLRQLQDWPSGAINALQRDGAVARVVVASVRGSAPREVGTCMLVGLRETCGTIGGGQLEWVAVEAARLLLTDLRAAPARVRKLVLGTELAQCCGGVVELWIERYTSADMPVLDAARRSMRSAHALLLSTLTDRGLERRIVDGEGAGRASMWFDHRLRACARLEREDSGCVRLVERLGAQSAPLWLYGAGHVGQALIRILEQLPVDVTWVDSRAELLPLDVAGSVSSVCAAEPLATVALAPTNTCFVVMTHSHALDYALCRAVLERGDFAWAGVIGSKSKAARFRSRLARHQLSPQQIARLVCPIGIAGIRHKSPPAVAVAVAAQLLQVLGSSSRDEATSIAADDSRACDGRCTTCGTAPIAPA